MRKFLTAHLILIVGLLAFASAKTAFIVVQTEAMGMPRLGDDALTHLWRARQIDEIGVIGALRGDLSAAGRGTKDIADFCQPDNTTPARERALCDRIADNIAVPDVKAGSSVMLNGIMKLGLPINWSYAVYEIFIAIVIATSFAFFLYRLFGPGAAGIGLALMSFMILPPPQGLQQFIPSTLTIGLSLALWGALIGSLSVGRYIAVAIGFLILSRIHPVALVYAGGIAVLACHAFRNKLTPKGAAVAALAAIAALGAFIALNDVIRDIISQTLSGNLFDKLSENLRALPSRLQYVAKNSWAITGAFLLGLVIYWKKIRDWPAATGTALLLLLGASLFYATNFFIFKIPLDLFGRIFVGFAVFSCGLVGVFLLATAQRTHRWSWAVVTAGILLLPVPSYFPWARSIFENINGRMEVIDSAVLGKVVSGIDQDATVAYGELEVTPTALFLAGASDRGAIPMKGMASETLHKALDERRPTTVVFPNFHILNSLATVQAVSLDKRRYGFASSAVDTFAVTSPRDTINTLYLRIENAGDVPASIGPIAYLTDRRQQQALPAVTVAAGAKGWVTIEISFLAQARTVILSLNDPGLWIGGIAVNEPPRPGVDWPWDNESIVQWHLRGRPSESRAGLAFTVPELFRYWRSPGGDMIPLRQFGRVINDESGIVFIATDYGASP